MHKVPAFFTFALLSLILIFSAQPSYAVNPDEVLSDPVLESRARDLSTNLRCLVCQNQSIDDSDASLAKDLRVLLRKRLVAGDSDEKVMNYIVSRYGEFVLLKPRLGLHTLLLWSLPIVLILFGFTLAFFKIRKRETLTVGDLTDDEAKRISKLLE